MGKRQPHWVIADWLGLLEPARGESCLLGQRRGPVATGEDNTIPGSETLPYLSAFNNPGTKTEIARVEFAARDVETPTPLGDY